MKEVTEHKYLGCVMSSNASNVPNILDKKGKVAGIHRNMEYYNVNRGDKRKWNKQTESSRSTNVKSSLLGCLVVRGSVSAEHGGSPGDGNIICIFL